MNEKTRFSKFKEVAARDWTYWMVWVTGAIAFSNAVVIKDTILMIWIAIAMICEVMMWCMNRRLSWYKEYSDTLFKSYTDVCEKSAVLARNMAELAKELTDVRLSIDTNEVLAKNMTMECTRLRKENADLKRMMSQSAKVKKGGHYES